MKKILFMLFMCVCMAVAFTSCGSSSEGSNDGSGSDGSDLVGKWQIKGMLNTEDNTPVAIDTIKGTGGIPADYEMILEIDEEMNCTIFNGKVLGKPFKLNDNADGSFSYTNDEGKTTMTVWTEENTIDFIKGDVVLCYGTEGKTVSNYFEKMSDSQEEDSSGSSLEEYVLKDGDTITTKDYEFTLDGVEFSHEVFPSDTSGYYYSYPADSGKVYIDVKAKVKNLMERDIRIDELYTCTATYDSKYSYTGFPIVDVGSRFDWVDNYSAATPLSTADTHYLIECPEEVESSDKPLVVSISLADGITYMYKIR